MSVAPAARIEPARPLLAVEALDVGFRTEAGLVRVLDGVGFSVGAGETVGLVGESGCGKSVSAMSIMRLIPTPPAVIEGGRILFDGRDLLTLNERDMRAVRGDRIGMIFQEPMTSLNPTFTIGFQIAEVLRLHRGHDRAQAEQEIIEMLRAVGVGAPERRLRQYPHQLSGGLRQRMMIAMALVCRPALLIADEPTTALDVTIQAQILDLLRRLQEQMGMAVLLITHDLGVVAEMCDRVVVMYAGHVVERCSARDLFRSPRHPYSSGLLQATPRRAPRGSRLPTIPGVVPPPGQRGTGCPFADRCSRVLDRCRIEMPPLAPLEAGHEAACWNPVPAVAAS
ncbi:MAG: ABC transporter ATP-binding protein [Rhodospirillaceae bacterium]|nr:ABC transporter ATP-binding protein [Rhodospirillaceae bacterium]